MLEELGVKAKEAERKLSVATTEEKNKILTAIAKALIDNTEKIVEANAIDLENGKKNGLSDGILDRLMLNADRIKGMARGVEDIVKLPDPVGKILNTTVRPNGLKIEKVSVPLGVIAVIFEARPNVTSDAAALCLKSGNTVILRGGKEAINSNKMITSAMRDAVKSVGMNEDVIQLVEDTSRESATALMTMNKYVDVLIPRGGAGLIQAVVRNATVPVIETGVGNCHIYVDKTADCRMGVDIIVNAKTSRPSVCNAIETILVHKDIAEAALPVISNKLKEKNVELRGDKRTCELLPEAKPATEADWATEYLDYILAVRVVDSLDAAIAHIAQYSTGHSECIVTENLRAAERFTAQVDAAAVYVNASTRFTDGGELGLGAEIGISTQKLHARGPMGLNELVSYKFIIRGDGQIR